MAVQYEGRSPGRLWYAYQRLKGTASTFKNTATRSQARHAAKATGVGAAGIIGVGAFSYYLPLLMAVPFVWPVAALTVIGTGMIGFRGLQQFKALSRTRDVNNYVSDREEAWVEKQKQPSLINRVTTALRRGIYTTAKYGGFTAAAAGIALGTVAGLAAGGVPFAVTALAAITTAASLTTAAAMPVAAVTAGVLAIGGTIAGLVGRNNLRVLNGGSGLNPGGVKKAKDKKEKKGKGGNSFLKGIEAARELTATPETGPEEPEAEATTPVSTPANDDVVLATEESTTPFNDAAAPAESAPKPPAAAVVEKPAAPDPAALARAARRREMRKNK